MASSILQETNPWAPLAQDLFELAPPEDLKTLASVNRDFS